MVFGLIVTAVALAVTALAALTGLLIDRSDAESDDGKNEHAEAKHR
jgi:Na+(H+)/acetate symporter ActP